MSCSPEGDLQFSGIGKNGQQLKYAGKESTHTHSTLRAIPSGVMNHISKLTSQKPSLNSERIDKVYPDHVNALRAAGLAPPNFPTMGYLWKNQDENLDIENEKEPDINKKENINFYFCVAYSRCFSAYIHRVINILNIF